MLRSFLGQMRNGIPRVSAYYVPDFIALVLRFCKTANKSLNIDYIKTKDQHLTIII